MSKSGEETQGPNSRSISLSPGTEGRAHHTPDYTIHTTAARGYTLYKTQRRHTHENIQNPQRHAHAT